MATGGSDETFEFICTPCCKDSKHVEAIVYCVDCKECLCETCFNFHQRFAAMVVHKVLDQAGMQAGGVSSMTSLPTETCDTHAGKLIVVYCGDHDALCCVECVSAGHRSCSETVYIPEASRGFKDSAKVTDIAMCINALTNKACEMKTSKQRDIKKTYQDKKDIIEEIRTETDRLIKKIKQLQQVSVDLVNNKHDSIEHDLKDEIKTLDQIITDAELVRPTLRSRDISESQIFINEKRGRRNIKDLRQKLDDFPEEHVSKKFVFLQKPEISRMMDSLNGLKSFVDHRTANSITHQETGPPVPNRRYIV